MQKTNKQKLRYCFNSQKNKSKESPVHISLGFFDENEKPNRSEF